MRAEKEHLGATLHTALARVDELRDKVAALQTQMVNNFLTWHMHKHHIYSVAIGRRARAHGQRA